MMTWVDLTISGCSLVLEVFILGRIIRQKSIEEHEILHSIYIHVCKWTLLLEISEIGGLYYAALIQVIRLDMRFWVKKQLKKLPRARNFLFHTRINKPCDGNSFTLETSSYSHIQPIFQIWKFIFKSKMKYPVSPKEVLFLYSNKLFP